MLLLLGLGGGRGTGGVESGCRTTVGNWGGHRSGRRHSRGGSSRLQRGRVVQPQTRRRSPDTNTVLLIDLGSTVHVHPRARLGLRFGCCSEGVVLGADVGRGLTGVRGTGVRVVGVGVGGGGVDVVRRRFWGRGVGLVCRLSSIAARSSQDQREKEGKS